MPETTHRSVGCLLPGAASNSPVSENSSSASESDICIERRLVSSSVCNQLDDDCTMKGKNKKWVSMPTQQFIAYTSLTACGPDKFLSHPNIKTDILRGLPTEECSEWLENDFGGSSSSPVDITISQGSMERPMRNLIVLSIGWMFFFMAFFSIRSLQSSLNHVAGLGLASLACIYAGFLVACVFTTAVVQNLGTKWTLVGSLICHIIYVAANIYPSFYTLVPTSLVAGFSQAAMWTAQGSYLIQLSRAESVIRSKSLKRTASKYFGIFFLFYSISPVFGSIMTSLLMAQDKNKFAGVLDEAYANSSNRGLYDLKNLQVKNYSVDLEISNINQSDNTVDLEPTCGAQFCHDQSGRGVSFAVTMEMRFILTSAYIICMVVSLLVFALFLENTPSPLKRRRRQEIGSQFSAILELLNNPKFHLLSPLIFYVGIQTAFYSGEITKAYVSCLFGMKMVGYSMACFGVSAALASYLTGQLQRYVSRLLILTLGALANVGCLLAMLLWEPSDGSLPTVLSIVGLWGVGDGIWMTHVNCVTGLLFADNTEAAYSAYQLTIALGLVVGYAYSQHLCMLVKIYITVVFCVIGIFGFAVLKWHLKRERRT